MKAVFDTADEVKFLITFSRESISSMTGDDLLNTMRGFVKSFNLKDVNPEIKEQILNSVAFLVTRTDENEGDEKIYKQLSASLKNFSKVQFKTECKEEIL
jgi:hypothetical protein